MKYIGIKQVTKAVMANEVTTVYIGKDAEEHIVSGLKELCINKNINVEYIDTMEELGKRANVEVPTSTAAV
jgi:large subunit ribosomal protein L7A